MFLEILQNSLEKICARVSFFINLQASSLQLYQNRDPAQVFPCEFSNFFDHLNQRTLPVDASHYCETQYWSHNFLTKKGHTNYLCLVTSGPNWKKKLKSQKKPKQPFRSVLENKPATRLKGKPARVFSREFCAVVRYYLICRAPGSSYFLQSPPWGVLKKNCSKNVRKKSEENIPLFYYLPDFLGREWVEFWNWFKIY